jgi:hypothetical protein
VNAITWAPGTNKQLDELFDHLRTAQYSNTDHRLWKNYGPEMINFSVALTIVFDNDQPVMCASIASRECWPADTYRILNRLWKVEDVRKTGAPGTMSDSFGYAALSQIDWLNINTSHKLYFISRETDNWERWVAKQFKQNHGLVFKIGQGKFLTCPNECDDSCWQHIIYTGDDTVLSQWKKQE